MILISHRGNIDGKNPGFENNPEYITATMKKGYCVEIDVWLNNGVFFLGHDAPRYEVDWKFLLHPAMWCHAKNIQALSAMKDFGAHCFWHQTDDVTLTSKGYLWTFPGMLLTEKSVCVMPEKASYTTNELSSCYGICTDNVIQYKGMLKTND